MAGHRALLQLERDSVICVAVPLGAESTRAGAGAGRNVVPLRVHRPHSKVLTQLAAPTSIESRPFRQTASPSHKKTLPGTRAGKFFIWNLSLGPAVKPTIRAAWAAVLAIGRALGLISAHLHPVDGAQPPKSSFKKSNDKTSNGLFSTAIVTVLRLPWKSFK